MVSKFWLYLGIILACSGIGTGVGIFLIILYVWGDIREAIDNNNVTNNNVTNNNVEEEQYNANYYSEDTAEEMR
jgi:hypothetical protein